MPLYEYNCESCKKNFEFMQKISETPIKKCPECGGQLAKLISSPAFHLKGTGWYKTDYASSGTQTNTKTPSSTQKDSGESKTEKKESTSGDNTETKAANTKDNNKTADK